MVGRCWCINCNEALSRNGSKSGDNKYGIEIMQLGCCLLIVPGCWPRWSLVNPQSSRPSPPHSCVSASSAASSQYPTHKLSRNGRTESPQKYLKLLRNFAITPSMLLVPHGYLLLKDCDFVLEAKEVLHLVVVIDALQQNQPEIFRRGHRTISKF